MRPNKHAKLAGREEPVSQPAVAPQPTASKRAYTGLAGSPLAVVEREVQSLATHPIQYDVAALHDGSTIGLPLVDKKVLRELTLALSPEDKKALRKLAIAWNAAEWRKNHGTVAHKQTRAANVKAKRAAQRAETERVEEIEAIHRTLKIEPVFVMTGADHGKGLIVTGGYDANKINEIEHGSENFTGKVTGPGHGSLDYVKNLEKEWDDQFVEKFFRRARRDKDVRKLYQFVREATFVRETPDADGINRLRKVPVVHRTLCCLICKQEITTSLVPNERVQLAYLHVYKEHRDTFQNWMTKLGESKGCQEDHAGMTERYAGGNTSLYCGCGKLLWEAPRLYTHKPEPSK